jgi:hypothetical protein
VDHWEIRVEGLHGIDPSLLKELRKSRSALRLHECLAIPRSGDIDVERRRRDVIVTCQDGPVRLTSAASAHDAVVGETRRACIRILAGLRIAVRKIETAKQNAANGSLDAAALRVAAIARKRIARE